MSEYIKSLLIEIKEQPAMFIGKKSLERLSFFLSGYSYCICKHLNSLIQPLPGFQEYIAACFNVESSEHWSSIIASNSQDDEAAFDKFYVFLEQFYKMRG